MQVTEQQDIWEWRKPGRMCRRKHVWVYYHSMGIRECACCPKRQSLWADFGIVKRNPKP